MKLSFRGARINAGFRQDIAAQKLNVSVATLSAWERGKWLPNILKSMEMAKLYGIDVNDFSFDPEADKKRLATTEG